MQKVDGSSRGEKQAHLPAPRAGGARFLLRAHYKHFCIKMIKSLERAGGAAAPCSPQHRHPGEKMELIG